MRSSFKTFGSTIKFMVALGAFSAAACASTLAPALAPRVSTGAAALRDGNYALDTDHAALLFKVGHLGFSKYIGRFERFNVTLDFDPDTPESARVEAVIDMTSLDVANDKFARTLMGSNWFDAERYPQTVFRSTGIEITGENSGIMSGDLTMHGVTKPVEMHVIFNGGGYDRLRGAYVVGMSASAKINRVDFGVNRFRALVSDEVELEIEAEFERQN